MAASCSAERAQHLWKFQTLRRLRQGKATKPAGFSSPEAPLLEGTTGDPVGWLGEGVYIYILYPIGSMVLVYMLT